MTPERRGQGGAQLAKAANGGEGAGRGYYAFGPMGTQQAGRPWLSAGQSSGARCPPVLPSAGSGYRAEGRRGW